MQDEVVTSEEIADFLKVDTAAVRKLLDLGELPGFRVGDEWRVLAQDFARFIAKSRAKQQLSGLNKSLNDPRMWARALAADPEQAEQIRNTNYPEGSMGAFLKEALSQAEAEACAPNVVRLPDRE